ncbi:MAG: hypothetical protein GX862_06030 [Leucobacter sp.]|jgi:hypothetical protein|nr:hypothetical protein [Leucobacter sp.]
MASAVSEPAQPATPEVRASRPAQLLRAAVLFIAGLAIAFTATMHDDVTVDLFLLGASLTLIAAATFVEYYTMRGTLESWWIAARAMVALGAAGALLAVTDSVSMALVVAVWAALTAFITLMRLVRGAQPRAVALPSLLLSLALMVAVLLLRNDAIAVIGLFGAYAIVRGVFLGISAFDTRAAQRTSSSPLGTETGAPATSGTQDD